jgi:hypothetical protein
MHQVITQVDGWENEMLRDDSDMPNTPETLEEELKGCCTIKEVKENNLYIAEIRYEERRHNQLVFVEALVFQRHEGESTEKDLEFFRRDRFDGDECKQMAANYALSIKNDIDFRYFCD